MHVLSLCDSRSTAEMDLVAKHHMFVNWYTSPKCILFFIWCIGDLVFWCVCVGCVCVLFNFGLFVYGDSVWFRKRFDVESSRGRDFLLILHHNLYRSYYRKFYRNVWSLFYWRDREVVSFQNETRTPMCWEESFDEFDVQMKCAIRSHDHQKHSENHQHDLHDIPNEKKKFNKIKKLTTTSIKSHQCWERWKYVE